MWSGPSSIVARDCEDNQRDASLICCDGSRQFGVFYEFRRRRRPPAVERVLLREVARDPGTLLGDVIEVVIVLGETPPWVARVVKVVRPDHVAADAPSLLPARVPHPHGAERN